MRTAYVCADSFRTCNADDRQFQTCVLRRAPCHTFMGYGSDQWSAGALHGEKVSVAALLVLEEYKRIAAAITQGRCHAKPYENEDEKLLEETFGKKGVLEEIKKENEPELLVSISPKHLEECLDGIAEIIDELPNEQDMFHLLEKAGCAKTVYDIGLDESAVLPSLRLAPYTRRRLSLLRISKMLDIRGE